MTWSLRARLTAISTIVFGLLIAALGVVSFQILSRRLDADATERLTELTEGLHGYLRFDGNAPAIVFDPSDSDQAAFVHEATRYYQVYDVRSGRLLVESTGFAPLGLQFAPGEVQAFHDQPKPFDVETDYGRLRISNSVREAGASGEYLLQVGVSLAPMDAALTRYRDLLIWRVPASLLVAAFAAWWFAGFALRPLSRVAAAASGITVKTLDRRLPVRGVRDELDQVADAFNQTLGRLEHAVGEMRQFSAALAHELRTPLAALRGEIELGLRAPGTSEAQQHAYASQIEEIDRVARLIDRILTLARAESGQIRLNLEPVDLGTLTASILEQLVPVAEAQAIVVNGKYAPGVVVDGDRGWLERLLLNLLDNAFKFTKAHGRVDVSVSSEQGAARIEVRDTGIGLSTDDVPRVFERFFRADPARSSVTAGVGLGLSLVQWIAEEHRGGVTVKSRLGEGTTFTVSLPLRR